MTGSDKLRFGLFEVDLASGELTKRGARVHLTDKPFQVLAALLGQPGELVSRQELQSRLWPKDTFVDFDNNLNAAVRKLREALGDSADSPRFVETLPRRGYRFIGSVERLSGSTARRRWALPAGLIVLLVLATVTVATLLGRDAPDAVAPAGQDRVMLAVMPFVDLDNRPDRRFFGDGLTEEMIMQLGRLQPERLGVIARISSMQYRNTNKTIDLIGDELGVDYVLEGSVRSSGDRVRITAQLIQVSDQTHLWAETYDAKLEDLLRIQGEVAIQVAQALALELLPDQPLARARAGTRVTPAYEAFLRGRFEWNTFSADRYPHAIEQFERAIELDPGYAEAWAALADTYNLQSFTSKVTPAEAYAKAREAALKAVELDPGSAMAHNALAFVLLYHDYDPRSADREFRRAVELAPNYAMAYHWWAGALAALEQHDEAIAAVRRAVELDPVSLSVLSDLGWYDLFAARWDEGIDECRQILDKQEYGWAGACVFQGLVSSGRLEEALTLTAFAQPEIRDELAGLAATDPGAVLRELERRSLSDKLADPLLRERYPLELALGAAAAGEPDAAFTWLERAYALRDPWLVFLKVDPRFDPLRGDPRLAELAARIGLR